MNYLSRNIFMNNNFIQVIKLTSFLFNVFPFHIEVNFKEKHMPSMSLVMLLFVNKNHICSSSKKQSSLPNGDTSTAPETILQQTYIFEDIDSDIEEEE